MAAKNLTAQQDRSRESVNKLLRAAADLLNEKGLKGTTIPKIAARAGLSPGAVYRRFPNKDALLREVFKKVLEGNEVGIIRLVESEKAEKMDFQEFVEYVISASLDGQRRYAGLLQALHQYVRAVPGARFRKKCNEIEVRTFRRIADFLSKKAGKIGHPEPQTAFPFALMLIGFTLAEIIGRNDLSECWLSLLPKNDEQLQKELTRAMLAYLGAEHAWPK